MDYIGIGLGGAFFVGCAIGSWSKTRIFAAKLLKKSISSKLEREHENNSQHQTNKVTQ